MSNLSDPLSDFLTRLRNGARAGRSEVRVPFSKLKKQVAEVLKREGYIANVEISVNGLHPELLIYNRITNRSPALTGLKRISKPGLRRYVGWTEIPRVLGGLGIAILSTSAGVMTGRDAKLRKVGGEVLAFVW